MNEDTKTLLLEFDDEQVVSQACSRIYGQFMFCLVPTIILKGWVDGHLEVRDSDGELKDTKALYSRLLILTDKGREEVGLPKLMPDVVKPKQKPSKKASAQKELF